MKGYKILRFRTKIEISITLLLLLIISVTIAVSVTRTISDSHDDFDTFIRNSNGNYWPATGDNIQNAIDDLGNNGGTVWVGSDTSPSSTIIMGKAIILDFQNHKVIPTSNFDIIRMNHNAQVKNVVFDISSVASFNSACILFHGEDKIHHYAKKSGVTLVDNVYVESDNHKGTAIKYLCDDYDQMIAFTAVSNVWTWKTEYVIHMYCSGGTASRYNFINGNNFNNIYGYNDKYFIYLENDNDPYDNTAGNTFINIFFQAERITPLPEDNSMEAIHSEDSSNTFKGTVSDWNDSYNQWAIHLTSESSHNYIEMTGISGNILDNSNYGNNIILEKGKSTGVTKLTIPGLHVTGKLTADGGVDPPFVSFSKETHETIREYAENVEEHEEVMMFWNEDTHRMEIYVISENAFYTLIGELIEE